MNPPDNNTIVNGINGLFQLLTLLGVLSSIVMTALARREGKDRARLVQEARDLSQENKTEVAIVKDLVNGQRHALESRITALEAKLETASQVATTIAKEKADLATELALRVAQTAAAMAIEQQRRPSDPEGTT